MVSKPLSGRARSEERVGPTPETLRKLRPDPLLALIATHPKREDVPLLEEAADEVRAVYMAIVRAAMRKGGLCEDRGGYPGVPPFLAWAHATTYLPWARSTPRSVLAAAITLIIERDIISPLQVIHVLAALQNYAERQHRRPRYEAEA